MGGDLKAVNLADRRYTKKIKWKHTAITNWVAEALARFPSHKHSVPGWNTAAFDNWWSSFLQKQHGLTSAGRHDNAKVKNLASVFKDSKKPPAVLEGTAHQATISGVGLSASRSMHRPASEADLPSSVAKRPRLDTDVGSSGRHTDNHTHYVSYLSPDMWGQYRGDSNHTLQSASPSVGRSPSIPLEELEEGTTFPGLGFWEEDDLESLNVHARLM